LKWLNRAIFQNSGCHIIVWHIHSNPQDTDSRPISFKNRSTYRRLYTAILTKPLIETVFILSLISVPIVTHAGLFSFVSDFISNVTSEIQENSSVNSQNIALLHSAITENLHARGGGDITIVGGSALLSETGPSGTLADISDHHNASSDQISIYVIREGDSLSQIAKMFNVTTNTIVWANDIKRGDFITPGQTLVILPVSGVRHTVKSGDTLASIAKKYKGDFDEILAYNRLSPATELSTGQIVVVPDGEIEAPKVTVAVKGVSSSSAQPNYSGYYIRPTKGIKTQGIHGYNGVDIGSPTGTPIVASASGEVIVARTGGWNGGYGNYVVLKHPNGTQTLYAHNSSNIVSQGQWVVQGQVIAYVGSTGKSTGPHIHFEVRGAKNPF